MSAAADAPIPAPRRSGGSPAPRRLGPPPLSETAALTTFGHLAWLVWFWVGVAAVFALALVAVGIWGELTSSLWQDLTGWLSWVILAAGITTVPTFGPMLVGNGVTRSQLSWSSLAAMVAIAAIGGVYVGVGYVVEHLVYDRHGWTQELQGGDVLGGWAGALGLGLAAGLTLACYYAAGWVVGAAYLAFGWVAFVATTVAAAVPVVLAELALRGGTWSTFDVLADVPALPGPVGAVAVVAVAVATAAAASRVTRGAVVRA